MPRETDGTFRTNNRTDNDIYALKLYSRFFTLDQRTRLASLIGLAQVVRPTIGDKLASIASTLRITPFRKTIEADICGMERHRGNFSADRRAELASMIGLAKAVRPVVSSTLTPDTEVVTERPELTVYRQEYDRLLDDIKARCNWEEITQRFLADDSKKLKLAKSMQGEGQLVGIDSEGKALIKDRGNVPVMYGLDEEGKLVQIYDGDQGQLTKVTKWANYFDIHERVKQDGYEMFTDNGDCGFSDEMEQVVFHTGELFLDPSSSSWLESGDKPDIVTSDWPKPGAKFAYFLWVSGRVQLNRALQSDERRAPISQMETRMSGIEESAHGVIRLLRV